ncbi:MAG TPA: 23S rRNA (pseudouridine(1915)-N(3))-methyltransferase RlmH [Terriglobales bacterium]|nr:23S rRNA (pseudouridine(1915)-N(3))-methyltransferase RlmH [Terriglobales bacterium]
MKLKVAWIGKTKSAAIKALTDEYLDRLSHHGDIEGTELASEEALLKMVNSSKTPPTLVLLDQHGRQLTSEELAEMLEAHQVRGTQSLLFAVGPADGFTQQARHAANLILSLGKMTLAHELARVVLLEQLYRGFTIVKGHPYHRSSSSSSQ